MKIIRKPEEFLALLDTYFDENGEISDEKLAQLEKKYLKKIND